MANSAQIQIGLDALLQANLSRTLRNTLFNKMPLMYFLLAKDGQKSDTVGLGRPRTDSTSPGYGGVFVSGMKTAKVKKTEILSARTYEPIIQTKAPAVTDGKVLGMYDSMPTRTGWETNTPAGYFSRPRVKWVERADPYEIPNKEIRVTKRTAKNEQDASAAIGSMFMAETESVSAVHEGWWNDSIWGNGATGAGSGAPTSEDATVWDAPHSLANVIHDSNTYCGVDRSLAANAYWRGNRVTTATVADFENIINTCNITYGLSKKGLGVDLILTDGANYLKAKAEAKSKGGQVFLRDPIPEFGQFGFQKECVKIDNTWILYDPACPTNHLAALNLSAWTLAIHPDANFKISQIEDYSKAKGGDDSSGGTLRTEALIVCEVPSSQVYFTAVS